VAEHLSELVQHLTGEEDFKLVDPKVKAAMTREMNSGNHAVKVVLPAAKKRRASVPEGDDLGDEADKDAPPAKDEGAEKDGEDDATIGGLVRKAKAKRGAAAKSAAGPGAKAKAKAGAAPAGAQAKGKDGARAKAAAAPPARGAGGAGAKARAAAEAAAPPRPGAKGKAKAKASGGEPPPKRARR